MTAIASGIVPSHRTGENTQRGESFRLKPYRSAFSSLVSYTQQAKQLMASTWGRHDKEKWRQKQKEGRKITKEGRQGRSVCCCRTIASSDLNVGIIIIIINQMLDDGEQDEQQQHLGLGVPSGGASPFIYM